MTERQKTVRSKVERNDYYKVGEVYPFTVTRIHDTYCELTDADGFHVFLQDTAQKQLVRGQQVRCRVVKNYMKRPKVELVETGYTSGPQTRVSAETITGLLAELKVGWATEPLAELLLTPDQGDRFDDGAQDWVSSLRREGTALDAVRKDCCRLMEQTPLLSLCTPIERQFYQQRLSALLDLLDCNTFADRLVRENNAHGFVKSLVHKLSVSGYVYRPAWNFNVLSCLFRLDAGMMERRMPDLFDVLRRWNPDMWMEEPLNGVLIDLVQLYIDRDIWRVDHERDNGALVASLTQALAIELKLLEARATDDEQMRLDLSRLSTLSSYAIANSDDKLMLARQTLGLSLSNLLNTQVQRVSYAWSETGSQRVPLLYSQLVPADIDTENTYIFEGGKLTIAPGTFALELGQGDKPREVLPRTLGLWGGLHVVADRGLLQTLSKRPSIADSKRFWDELERTVFSPAQKTAETPQRKRHRVGETVTITILRQDADDPNRFSAQIEDEQGGEGFIMVSDIVPYTMKANITHFRWRNGHRMFFAAEIIDIDDDGLFHFRMLELIKRDAIQRLLTDDEEVLVSIGQDLPANRRLPVPGVTQGGISASIIGFDEVDCSMVRKGQLLRARYRGEAQGTFSIQCKAVGPLPVPTYNDIQAAFLTLMERYAYEDEQAEDDREEYQQSDRILDESHVREIVRIIDRMAVLDNEYVKSYNYLGFARVLCRLIGWESQAEYYRGRMELIVLLHDFAINDMVNEERLEQLATSNAELFQGNALLRGRFLQLQMVSYMGRDDHDNELWATYCHDDGIVKDVASLVLAYNMLVRNNMPSQAIDIQNRIKKTLRLEGYESRLKIYGSGIEDQQTEYKTSIVFPPDNNMLPDPERQMHNILGVIASFINTDGGTLYLGVNDSGAGTGLEADLSQSPYHGDKDRYQRDIVDAVSRTWGNSVAANHLSLHYDLQNTDKDVLIVTVTPSQTGVLFDGFCPVRVGSTRRRLTPDEYAEYKVNRARRALGAGGGSENSENSDSSEGSEKSTQLPIAESAEKPIAESAAPTAVSITTAPTNEEKIPTSRNRNNTLHDWEDGYVPDIAAYVKLTEGKWSMTTLDDYDETQLTLAVHDDERDAYLVLGYSDGTVLKVPMRELLKADQGRTYNRFTGVPLTFATIARDSDLLCSITTENRKKDPRRMIRVDAVSRVGEGKLADRGTALYNEGLCQPGAAYEVIPASAHAEEPLENLIDRGPRSLGMQLKTSPREVLRVLSEYGIES